MSKKRINDSLDLLDSIVLKEELCIRSIEKYQQTLKENIDTNILIIGCENSLFYSLNLGDYSILEFGFINNYYRLIDANRAILSKYDEVEIFNFRNKSSEFTSRDINDMNYLILSEERILCYDNYKLCILDIRNKKKSTLNFSNHSSRYYLHPSNDDLAIMTSHGYLLYTLNTKTMKFNLIDSRMDGAIDKLFILRYNKEYILCMTEDRLVLYNIISKEKRFLNSLADETYRAGTSVEIVEISKNLILLCLEKRRIFEIHIKDDKLYTDIFIPKVAAPHYKLIDIFEANMFALLKNSIQLEFYHKKDYKKSIKTIVFPRNISNVEQIAKDYEGLSLYVKESIIKTGFLSINIVNIIRKFIY